MDCQKARGEFEETLICLTDGVSLSDSSSKENTTTQVNFEDIKQEEHFSSNTKDVEFSNPECSEADTYNGSESFEQLSKKMTDVLPDGKIKKRILHEGYGPEWPDDINTVKISFQAYEDGCFEPFDPTFGRETDCTICLNARPDIVGMNICIRTMKLKEKAQFLMHPHYAYDKRDFSNYPPCITDDGPFVLYEIEIKDAVFTKTSISYSNLNEEKQKDFTEIYMSAQALCFKGNQLYSKNLIKLSVKEYNGAVAKLEMLQLKDPSDQEKQQKLLLQLFTNLVAAYTKIQEPRLASTNSNRIYEMCKGTNLKISSMVYLNHARSLMLLNDYDLAERQLKEAYRVDPQNKDIAKEIARLHTNRNKRLDHEGALAKAILRSTKLNKESLSKDVQDSIIQYCKDLIEDKESTQYNLPNNLSKYELEFIEKEVCKHQLEFKSSTFDKVKRYFIAKPSDMDQNKEKSTEKTQGKVSKDKRVTGNRNSKYSKFDLEYDFY